MEIIDNKPPVVYNGYRRQKNVYLGFAIIACGTVWLMYNFDLVGSVFFERFFSWQTLLVGLGGYLMVMRRWIVGCALVLIGASMGAIDWYGLMIPLRRVVLPLVVIAAGIGVILRNKN